MTNTDFQRRRLNLLEAELCLRLVMSRLDLKGYLTERLRPRLANRPSLAWRIHRDFCAEAKRRFDADLQWFSHQFNVQASAAQSLIVDMAPTMNWPNTELKGFYINLYGWAKSVEQQAEDYYIKIIRSADRKLACRFRHLLKHRPVHFSIPDLQRRFVLPLTNKYITPNTTKP